MRRILVWLAGILVALALALVAALWWTFGGGKPYADLSGPPRLPEGTIEAAVVFDRPIGNAAVAADGRLFFTVHPESNPEPPFLYEWVAGQAVPYAPAAGLMETPLGVTVDRQNRLWVIDPGRHGFGTPAIFAFDLATDRLVYRHDFTDAVAPRGSFLQAMNISSDGRWIYIADVGFWARRPAIVVLDSQTDTAWRHLNRHPSVSSQNLLIRNQIRDMSFFGGILQMKTGVDGVALSRDDAWLYYAAMNHDTLYRVPARALQDPAADVAARIEEVGKKPLNDGLSIDDEGNIFITDIEHQAVMAMRQDGRLETVVKDSRIRWADSLSFGPEGWLYLADSAIPELVLQSAAHHAAAAPYTIWRFKPGTSAPAGQ